MVQLKNKGNNQIVQLMFIGLMNSDCHSSMTLLRVITGIVMELTTYLTRSPSPLFSQSWSPSRSGAVPAGSGGRRRETDGGHINQKTTSLSAGLETAPYVGAGYILFQCIAGHVMVLNKPIYTVVLNRENFK
jgi:hypothetical protein